MKQSIATCCAVANGKVSDSFHSVHDVPLHYTGRGKGGKGDAQEAAPPDAVIQEIDSQELNRVFVRRCVARAGGGDSHAVCAADLISRLICSLQPFVVFDHST